MKRETLPNRILSGVFGLAVFAAIMQAAPPTPRQTPDSSASASTANQKQTENKNSPSKSLSAAIDKNQSETANSDTAKQGDPDIQNSVTVRELPPVTINNRRDWADWGLWFFTFLLAFTGLMQIILLWKTLKVTSKQADIANRQEFQMVEAGKQTAQIIAQTKDTAVRDLRAYVGVSQVKLDLDNMQTPLGLVEIQNFGKTPAYKVRHWTAIGIQPYPPSEELPELPDAAKSSVTAIFPQIKNLGRVALKKPLPQGVTLGTRELTVYVYGRISYEDAFKNDRYSNFRFIFGGTEKSIVYRDDKGKLWGAMRPDVEGNDAD